MNDHELDKLLRDPRVHGETVAPEQVAAWGEQVVRRWQGRRMLETLLYRGSVGIGLGLLLLRMWEESDLQVEQVRALPSAVSEGLAGAAEFSLLDYPYLVAAIGISCAVLLTRPLRERLFEELG